MRWSAAVAIALTACSATAPAEEPPRCAETIAQYCASRTCVLDGVRSVDDLRAWCLRAGALAPLAEGFASCETHVIIDVRESSQKRELYYDKSTGRLTTVIDYASSPSTCAGERPTGCTLVVGVGVSCKQPP